MFSWIVHGANKPRWNLPESQTSHPGVLNAALTPSTMLKCVRLSSSLGKKRKEKRGEKSSSAAGFGFGPRWKLKIYGKKLDRFSIKREVNFLMNEFFSKVCFLRIFCNGNSW